MAALFAQLNNVRVASGSVVIPYHGIWHADLRLSEPVTVSGLCTLTVAGLVMKGTAYRQGGYAGTGYVRLVGGNAGWLKTIPAKEYRSAFGVKLGVIVGDAARECGEQVTGLSDSTVGSFYERASGPAARVLDTFLSLWWMRPDGVTSLGNRTATTISSQYDVIADGTDLSLGKVAVATDHPEDWQPAAKFSNPVLSERTISGVIHKLTADRLRTELWVL